MRLWRASFEHGVGIVDPHPIEEQRAYFFEQVLPRNDVRVAVVDGKLGGFIASTPESIAQLHVRVSLLRRGIGSLLLEDAKAHSSGSLWLYTFERNAVARAFYERHGFRIVARGFEPQWQLADLKYEWVQS